MAFSPDAAFQYLATARREGRLGHAYLVSGLGRNDRLKFAERLIRLVNDSTAPNLQEMAAEGVTLIEPEMKSRRIGIEAVRDFERSFYLRGAVGKTKVGIFVDADRLTQQATNAFLKTLEEPPAGSLLILLTASPAELLDTVLSRCIKVPLFLPESQLGDEDRPEEEKQLLDALARHFSGPLTPPRALALGRMWSTLLDEIEETIAKTTESEHKKEVSHYRDTTGASGAWLKEREDHYKALSSSRYQQQRKRLAEVLLLWFGDLIRLSAGGDRVLFSEYRTVLETAAPKTDTADLLRRLRCLEDLLRYYETNVSEALATELTFLGAFG